MSAVAVRAGACLHASVPLVPYMNDCLPWFAVRVREKFRASTEMMLAAQGIEFFSPKTTEVRQWSDRRKTVAVPLFSGYLFCRFNPKRLLIILKTLGVIDVVRIGDRLAEVDPAELDAVRRAIESRQPIEELPELLPGQRVRVVRGAMRGIEGVLVEIKAELKLVLSVTMMNRAVALQIGRLDVEALNETA